MANDQPVKTGSMGGDVREIKSTSRTVSEQPDGAVEQVEKQSRTVEGPSEATSADKDVEGTDGR